MLQWCGMPLDDIIANNENRKTKILADKCKGCTVCLKKCPTGAITGERKLPHSIDADKCNNCGECAAVCKFDAIVGLNLSKPPTREAVSQETWNALQVLDMLDRLCDGKGTPEDWALLESVSKRVKAASNQVLSRHQHFRSDYAAFIRGERAAHAIYQINEECNGCTICTQHCPTSAIPPIPYRRHSIDTAICIKCDVCRQHCPRGAVVLK